MSWMQQREAIRRAADAGARPRISAQGSQLLPLRDHRLQSVLLTRPNGQLTRAGQFYRSITGRRPFHAQAPLHGLLPGHQFGAFERSVKFSQASLNLGRSEQGQFLIKLSAFCGGVMWRCHHSPDLASCDTGPFLMIPTLVFGVKKAAKKGHSFVPHTPRLGRRQTPQKNGQHSVPRQSPSGRGLPGGCGEASEPPHFLKGSHIFADRRELHRWLAVTDNPPIEPIPVRHHLHSLGQVIDSEPRLSVPHSGRIGKDRRRRTCWVRRPWIWGGRAEACHSVILSSCHGFSGRRISSKSSGFSGICAPWQSDLVLPWAAWARNTLQFV